MERRSVHNLINKFEKLSSSIEDISESPHCLLPKVAKQHNIGMQIKQKTEESLLKIPAFGCNTNTIVSVEHKVRLIEQMLKNASADDKIGFFTVYKEMMDALIQLARIDTDGQKSLKAKKECCLMELCKMKEKIIEWIPSPSATSECTGDMLVSTETSSVALGNNQFLMPSNKSLVTKFSVPNIDCATPKRTPTFRNVGKIFDDLATGITDEHTECSKLCLSLPVNHNNTPVPIIPESISLAHATNNGASERQHCETTDYFSTAIAPEGSIEDSDRNGIVDEDHLASSLHQLYHYKRLMHSYANNRSLEQYEDKINDEYQFLSHFNPHVTVLRHWKELTQGYKDLLDDIYGRKSKLECNDVANENDSENTIFLDKVKPAISKYKTGRRIDRFEKCGRSGRLNNKLGGSFHDFGMM